MSRSDESFCVAEDAFEYSLPGDLTSNLLEKSNLPYQPCKAGQYLRPASIYNPAPSGGCDPHGFYCVGYVHFHLKLKTDRAIPVGPQTVTSSRSPDAPTPAKTPAQTAEPSKPAPEPTPAQVRGSILKALQDAADDARQQRAQAEQAGRQREAQEDDARTKRAEARIDALRGAAAQGNAKAQLSVKLADEYNDSWKQLWASPQYAVSAYDPQWMGKNVVLRGTVASVQLDTSGYPVYMTVYFKESPDGTVTVYSPYSDLFRGKYGSDFSGLIGKAVEVAGHVNHFRKAKASINITDPKQLRVAGNP